MDWIDIADNNYACIEGATSGPSKEHCIGEAQAAALIAIAQELRKLNEQLEAVIDQDNCIQAITWMGGL